MTSRRVALPVMILLTVAAVAVTTWAPPSLATASHHLGSLLSWGIGVVTGALFMDGYRRAK